MKSTATRRPSMIAALPEWVKAPLRPIRAAVGRIPYYGVGRWCPVCERESRRFQPTSRYGIVSLDARCMYCGALPRHRLAWRFFAHHTDLFDGRPKKMLHVAPEPYFESRLRNRIGAGYVTADLSPGRADVVMDITAIEYSDATFDAIYCSHVLEHVVDDRQAMREFRRVLRPGGWAESSWSRSDDSVFRHVKTRRSTTRKSGSTPFSGRKTTCDFMVVRPTPNIV